MRSTLLQKYHSLKESGANATSDFPLLLGNVMNKVLLNRFKGVNSPWRSYTLQGELTDFKTADRIITGEAPDLLKKTEGGGYEDSTFSDRRYQMQLETVGRTFTVTREAVINDDLRAITQQPARFGRSAARTLSKEIVDILEGSHNAYDGTELFRHGTNLNNGGIVDLANDADGIAAVAEAMTAIENATEPDSGEKMGLRAKYLLVPPDLEDAALRITDGQAQFRPVSTAGGTTSVGKAKRLEVLVEPFFTDAARWYVVADPMDAHAIEVDFLNGKQTPDLLVKRADAVQVAGGEDPYGYEFDDISYKVRWDYDVAAAYYQAIYANTGD